MTFQQKLREAVITNVDPKKDPNEVLIDIFKYYVAEMLKTNILQNKNRIAAGFIEALCGHTIKTFRDTDLGDFQKNEKWYGDLFNKTIQEILNDAGNAHEGQNAAVVQQQLHINKKLWHQRQSGLIIPGR